jgi:hypothetical protein
MLLDPFEESRTALEGWSQGIVACAGENLDDGKKSVEKGVEF